MGYVAVKGGQEAIAGSHRFYRYRQAAGGSPPLAIDQIRDQLHFAIDRVMGEGALYAPDLAALAFKQACGDILEAAFIVRAYRTTQPRLGYSLPVGGSEMRVLRRISSSFKDIPGGQILGPTPDYTVRLLDFELTEEPADAHRSFFNQVLPDLPAEEVPDTLPKVIEVLRREGLVVARDARGPVAGAPFDITRESIAFPAPRSASLQTMARAETGGLLALAYSNMRGYGMLHPNIGELRFGLLPLRVANPYTGEPEWVGEVRATEAEVLYQMDCGQADDGPPQLSLGYGLCLGHNETKAISMAVLDRAMQTDEPTAPSEDQEFVLTHTDGIESMGFCNHYKLPHYVTFQSALDRLRAARARRDEGGEVEE